VTFGLIVGKWHSDPDSQVVGIMSTSDVLTLIIALWGAVISTILGIRELRKEKRNLWVVLERQVFVERFCVVITNIGYRPVTISSIFIGWTPEKKENNYPGEKIPASAMVDPEDDEKLPITLEDGQSIVLRVGQILSDMATSKNLRLGVIVYDSQGKKYQLNERRMYNPKHNIYEPMK
jgi:hypothetical protein